VTRRALLLALVAMLVGGLVRWARELRGRSAEGSLERRLLAHLDYLPIDGEVVGAFARDYRADATRLARGEAIEPIASRFLLSTDFFQNGADESRPLRYVTYYDPYRSPCYNPLRVPWPDDAQTSGGLRQGPAARGAPSSGA
jgi:hypothetical protein